MTTLPPDAVAALKRGSKIEAIKCVRVAHGLGLKQAKEAVEAYAKTHAGELRSGSNALVRKPSGSRWWIVVLLVAAVLAYLLVPPG